MTKPLHVINYEGKEYRIPFDLDLEIDKLYRDWETKDVANKIGRAHV